MQRISRAPELSATLSRVSCWTIALSDSLHDLEQAPALGLRQRPRLDDPHRVALLRLVAGVVGVKRRAAAHDLLVSGVAAGGRDLDGECLVDLGRDDLAQADLLRARRALGRRSSPARLAAP